MKYWEARKLLKEIKAATIQASDQQNHARVQYLKEVRQRIKNKLRLFRTKPH